MKKYTTLLLLWIFTGVTPLIADNGSADFMRSIGKIYVVVAVIAAILATLFGYLFYMDRKLTKLEHQIKNNE